MIDFSCEIKKWDISVESENFDEYVKCALALVWKVFLKFEAPEYSNEGVREFRSFLDNNAEIEKLKFYGAFKNDCLIGVLAMRDCHISLFFVDENYHRKGIGKLLFCAMNKDFINRKITVNSSPYAVEIYKKLGFIAIDKEQLTNGIRYTPMIYKK